MSHDATQDVVEDILAQLREDLREAKPPGAHELTARALQAAHMRLPGWPLLVAAMCSSLSLLAMYTQLRRIEEQLLVFLP